MYAALSLETKSCTVQFNRCRCGAAAARPGAALPPPPPPALDLGASQAPARPRHSAPSALPAPLGSFLAACAMISLRE
jgi:hypothetical protein